MALTFLIALPSIIVPYLAPCSNVLIICDSERSIIESPSHFGSRSMIEKVDHGVQDRKLFLRIWQRYGRTEAPRAENGSGPKIEIPVRCRYQ